MLAEGVLISSRNTPQHSPLPSELLSHIFRYYLQMSSPYNPKGGLRLEKRCLAEHLLLVCRAWHDAATADSSLWREIILDPRISFVTPYKSLYAYTRVRSIRSRTQLLHVSINNNRGPVKRLPYLQAYYYLITTMSRWERLFYYLEQVDANSCVSIYHLTTSTPNLREVVIWSSANALAGISQVLPETPNLTSLEICIPCIGPLPHSLCKSVTTASIQTSDARAWTFILSQLKSVHTLILQPAPIVMAWAIHNDFMRASSLELPSVQTLILVGSLDLLQLRLRRIKFPALRTLEVDLSPSGVEKQWSKASIGAREQLKSLFTAGLQKLVLKSIWFDQWEDVVSILQDTREGVGELVCFDVTCTLQCGKEQEVAIDLGAVLIQQGAVSSASALSMLDGLLKEHGIELSDLLVR